MESSTNPPVEDSARPAVTLDHVSKVFGTQGDSLHALDNITLDGRAGRVRVPARRVRLRQEHAAQHRRRPRCAERGHRRHRRRAHHADVPGIGALPLADRSRATSSFRSRSGRSRAPSDTQKADELLELVNLSTFGGKLPHELSGGMRQRVALARALAQEADVLLMDEPFGALDAMTRDVLHEELERVWRETGLTVIFVTHNVREAVRLGDRVDSAVEPTRADRRGVPDQHRSTTAPGFVRRRRARGHDHRPAQGGGAPPWPLTSAP